MDRNAKEPHTAGLAQRIDDRSRVHPELDNKAKENLKVTIFGCHRRDDGAESQG